MPSKEKLEQQLLAVEKMELEQRLKFLKERNQIFASVQDFTGRYIVLIGGSGSGKSYEAGDRITDRMVMEHYSEKPHRFLCVRAERNKITESMFPLFLRRMELRYPQIKFEVHSGEGKEWIGYKKNEIIFAGLDDVGKLKSIFDVTGVWVEEADQISLSDFTELDRRLRGMAPFPQQIILSFNPVSILSYIKPVFFDGRDKRTVCLRGESSFENFKYYKSVRILSEMFLKTHTEVVEGKEITEPYYHTLIIHSTYKDNRFIGDDEYRKMQRLKETDEGEYNIYALGQWGLVGGSFFDKKKVNERIIANVQPLKRGYFEFKYINEKIIDDSIVWVDDEDGYVWIYEEPKEGYPYVSGGDTAGETGKDWNTGYFTNNVTKNDVAKIRCQHDEDLYARQMYCLGKYYGYKNNCNGDALIGIETKFSTHPVKELMRLGYWNQYIREEAPDSITGKTKKIFGFDTNSSTRPTALGMLRTEVRENPERFLDIDLLLEMTTFVKNDHGRPEAIKGAHDDCVMARAINCYISHQKTEAIDAARSVQGDEDEDDYKKPGGFYD